MSITDELREFANRAETLNTTAAITLRLRGIADRIDAEHQKAEDEWKAKDGQSWLSGYGECHTELMEGNEAIAADLEEAGWVQLPKDADGLPIHIGDTLDGYGKTTVVKWLTLGDDGWSMTCENGLWFDFTAFTHHKPTVEDVLREFSNKVCNSGHQWGLDAADTIAEYADRIRKAVEHE